MRPDPATGDSDAELLTLAVDVARSAGRLILDKRRGVVEVADTKSSPTDIVTEADLASEQLIRSRIRAVRPDDGFVGEEGDEVTGSSGLTWVADPIDGTVNYLYALGQFGVSLAARDEDGTVVAAVHHPVTGETFTAMRGRGAWLDGAPVTPSGCTDPARALVGTGYSYRADVRAHQAAETARLLPRIRDIRRFGSAALDLCLVACGRCDAYVERGLKPWDLEAGRLICAEAGVRVEGVHGDDPSERLVVAAPRQLFVALHAELVNAGYADWPLADWP